VKLEYFIVSESYSIDHDSNKVSIFDILEEITVDEDKLPLRLPQACAVATWIVEEGDNKIEWQAKVRITNFEDKANDYTINLAFVEDALRHRIAFTIGHLPITKLGNMTVELLLNDKHQASHTISVKKVS